jgi:hypothetical protein
VLTAAQRNQRLNPLEFKVLCPHLMYRFIDEAASPNFKRLRRASSTSFADSLPPTPVRGRLGQALAYLT